MILFEVIYGIRRGYDALAEEFKSHEYAILSL